MDLFHLWRGRINPRDMPPCWLFDPPRDTLGGSATSFAAASETMRVVGIVFVLESSLQSVAAV